MVDVGIHRLPTKKLVGDVDFARVAPLASAITPVPRGIGPLTVAQLLVNTLKVKKPDNEPIKDYLPGSAEKVEIKAQLKKMLDEQIEIPMIIGGDHSLMYPDAAGVVDAYGVGKVGSETTINSGDLAGVTLAGMRALDADQQRLELENRRLGEENQRIEARLEKLEQQIREVEARR